MISKRYICFALYYLLINFQITRLDELTIESMFSLFTSTMIFFYILKFLENEKKSEDDNTANTKTLISISIVYGLLSLSIKYIYYIFTYGINIFIRDVNISYIPEAFFISGGLLFINQLVIMIYPYL